MRVRTDILEKKEEILELILKSQPKAEIARKLNCKIDTLNTYLKKMGIEYAGNQGRRGRRDSKRIDTLTFMKGNSSNSQKR